MIRSFVPPWACRKVRARAQLSRTAPATATAALAVALAPLILAFPFGALLTLGTNGLLFALRGSTGSTHGVVSEKLGAMHVRLSGKPATRARPGCAYARGGKCVEPREQTAQSNLTGQPRRSDRCA